MPCAIVFFHVSLAFILRCSLTMPSTHHKIVDKFLFIFSSIAIIIVFNIIITMHMHYHWLGILFTVIFIILFIRVYCMQCGTSHLNIDRFIIIATRTRIGWQRSIESCSVVRYHTPTNWCVFAYKIYMLKSSALYRRHDLRDASIYRLRASGVVLVLSRRM